ncbi:MAG: hypothetical protein P8N76_16250 [Pirellulaceae bacterium]|nr:hypothetical protein [Pirellulaceae bacterium]
MGPVDPRHLLGGQPNRGAHLDFSDDEGLARKIRSHEDAIYDANLHIARATDAALAVVVGIIDRNTAALRNELDKLTSDLDKITNKAVDSLKKAGFAGNEAATLYAARQTEKVKAANGEVVELRRLIQNHDIRNRFLALVN